MAPDCRVLPDPNSVSGDAEPAAGRFIRTANLPGRQDFRMRLKRNAWHRGMESTHRRALLEPAALPLSYLDPSLTKECRWLGGTCLHDGRDLTRHGECGSETFDDCTGDCLRPVFTKRSRE